MECENFCEIYLKTFKEANDPEVFFKIIQLDGCFAKNFRNQIKNFEGIQKYRRNSEIEDDEVDEDDEEKGKNTYILKRPDFWTLKIQLELEEVEPLLKDYFYEERSILIGDPIIFYTQRRNWDDLPNTEIISWREAKKRDIKRKRSKDWEVTRWHTYQHRDDGILEVRRHRLDDQEENIFVVTSATFEVFFDTEGHKEFHKI
uniref:Uncharacterized protein n=1 Tax=Acrobeloides nanus TaxID=290746 RepID=A0A914CFA6_9BILA